MASTESHTHDDARIATTEDTYRARRRTTERNRVVGPDGRRLDPRTDLVNHSPTGLEWGYGGSGPAQLALALLADQYADPVALDHYQDFKNDVVAPLDGDEWALDTATGGTYYISNSSSPGARWSARTSRSRSTPRPGSSGT